MISISQMLGQAVIALWRRRVAVLGLTVVWLALDSGLVSYLKTFHPAFGLGHIALDGSILPDTPLAYEGLLLAIALMPEFLQDIIRALFIVLILRTLLAPTGRGERGYGGPLGPALLVLAFELAVTVATVPAEHAMTRAIAVGEIEAGTIMYPLVKASLNAAYALAMARLCFVYPHAALGFGLRLRQSWRKTRGLALRMCLILLLLPLPFAALAVIVPVFYLSGVPPFEMTTDQAYQHLLVVTVAGSAATVVASLFMLAIIAAAYVAATGHPAAAVPGPGRTPEQLAEAFE